jgi:hypothetical protein
MKKKPRRLSARLQFQRGDQFVVFFVSDHHPSESASILVLRTPLPSFVFVLQMPTLVNSL